MSARLPSIPRDDKHCQANIVIKHPRFKQLQRAIEDCIKETIENGEAQCFHLYGEPGVGKSTLVQSFADLYPRYKTDSGWKIPVLYIETPHPVTPKGMSSAILDALGDPQPFKGTQPNLNRRIRTYIAKCDVTLIICDDFHHLIDRKTNRILRDVADWLKVLIKETRAVYLVVGVDERVKQILDDSKQLRRLFAEEKLEPFGWDNSPNATNKEFSTVISYVLRALEVELASELQTTEMMRRIHHATGGLMKNIMQLCSRAKREATGHTLTLDDLATAYERRVRYVTKRENPFLTPANMRFWSQEAGILPPAPPEAVSNRSKQRKPKVISANEVLTKR